MNIEKTGKSQKLQEQSIVARGAILKMTTLAGSGHPGGSMSTIDLLLSLYSEINHDPQNPLLPHRDRIVISHGHVSPAAYSALAINGYFDLAEAIAGFRFAGSIFEGHVEPDVPGIEWASGNLGQGLSAGCGFALANKIKGIPSQVYVLMGDGEQQKGQLSEARRFAVKFGLHHLTGFCDFNGLQISGKCNMVMPQNIRAEYEADGWVVLDIDGHDFVQIIEAIREAKTISAPVLILAHTVMGKGVSFMENDEKWHGQALPYQQENGIDLINALQELGIKDDLEKYRQARAQLSKPKITWQQDEIKTYPLSTGKHKVYEAKTDNRSAWGNALAEIAELNAGEDFLPIAVFDCDLAGSVKTARFAKTAPQNFIQSGIMEHHTAVCAGALSKCGFQTFFSDFGVFGIDETYNQQRLNDINRTNLKVMLTHVGIDVGEDGKTHQCVDYLGQARNMFHFKCIIPGDPNQTDLITRWVAGREGNFLVPMGRSKLDIIRTENGKIFYDEEYVFEYGKADKLRSGSQGALLVMGTLTPDAVKAADILKEQGIAIQVWNISCPQELDKEMLHQAAATGRIFTYEDHNPATGLAACLQAELVNEKLSVDFMAFGVRDYPISGRSSDVYACFGLDADSIVKAIAEKVNG
ncbi:MAG: transketolase [Candidatus Cloacimonetes bacterium]|nr:transketolase [Candidatus Cloacimonadota bacterium]